MGGSRGNRLRFRNELGSELRAVGAIGRGNPPSALSLPHRPRPGFARISSPHHPEAVEFLEVQQVALRASGRVRPTGMTRRSGNRGVSEMFARCFGGAISVAAITYHRATGSFNGGVRGSCRFSDVLLFAQPRHPARALAQGSDRHFEIPPRSCGQDHGSLITHP